MKKSRFTDQQIRDAVHDVEAGASVTEVIERLGVSKQTFYRWKRKFGEPAAADPQRVRKLEEENRHLRQMVGDLSLDKRLLEEEVRKYRKER